MDLYEAIIRRKSVRNFEDRVIPKEVLSDILEYAKSVEPLDDSIKINIEIVECSKRIFSAPYYIVIFSDEKEGYGMNAGYVMQHIVMYLTSMGLGSCYQAMTGAVAKCDAVGRKKVVAAAFGYADEEPFRDPLESSRMTQRELCLFKEEPSGNIYKLIEAVRMAPSSFNSQPWRMVVYEHHMHIFVKKSKLYVRQSLNYINIGIALANIDMASDSQWIDIVKKRITVMKGKGNRKLEYVISLKNVLDNTMS
ncbi:MAG: nitroreductase family protein [Lachnospiraceae bacterium]|nr:nitroreductase family protein [Lachnospiraceae bacterium]